MLVINNVNYDLCFRGLHYDVEKGLFLKVDSFHQIQLGTVYRYTNSDFLCYIEQNIIM